MSDVSVSDTASWADAQADTPTMGKDFSDSEVNAFAICMKFHHQPTSTRTRIAANKLQRDNLHNLCSTQNKELKCENILKLFFQCHQLETCKTCLNSINKFWAMDNNIITVVRNGLLSLAEAIT